MRRSRSSRCPAITLLSANGNSMNNLLIPLGLVGLEAECDGVDNDQAGYGCDEARAFDDMGDVCDMFASETVSSSAKP